jgi:predicted P-loop ATPase
MFSTTETLNAQHLQEWQASGVQAGIIERNVWTITDARDLDQLLNRNTDRRWKHSEDLVPGWAVAGVDPKSGERTYKGAQFKPNKAPLDPDTQKARKYFSPSRLALSPLFLEMEDPEYWAKLLFTTDAPIVLTEGAKKAGAVLSKGIPCISIPGVTAGAKLGRLRPELELYCRYGRSIYLAFDRDIVSKPAVKNALHNLGRMIAAKGAVLYVLEWNNFQKGIDDFLAAGGDIHSRMESAKTLEEWRSEQDETDIERSDIETCKLALRYRLVEDKFQGRIRWNNLKGLVELDGQAAELDELRLQLALKHNVEIPSEDCAQIISYLAKQQTFHPVAEYLNQCASLYSPDDDLLNSIAQTYLGADSPLHAAFIRKTLISAVARALSPGCKVDTVCILSGGQGVGKSSFWRVLAGDDWFDDSIGSVSDKDERLKLHQAWLVEWAELEAVFKRKDISAVKAFITTQYDQIRPPYGRTVKEFPRPSIIVGTTNFDEFLADPTGNRRFWVVPTKAAAVPLEELASERDRIWAAAVHAFLQGETWTLPTELKQLAVETEREYEMSDPWEDPVLEYVTGLTRVTASEILVNALHMDLDRQDRASQMRVTNLLKSNHWTTSREVVHGRRLRFWFPPSFKEGGCPGCPEEAETQTAVAGQPSGQPPGQPSGQPPDLPSEALNIPLMDNLDNLDNQIPKRTRGHEASLCETENDGAPLNGSQPKWNCEILLEDEWIPALYQRGLNKSVFSPITRKLETAHRVQIPDGPDRLTRWEVTDSALRRLNDGGQNG